MRTPWPIHAAVLLLLCRVTLSQELDPAAWGSDHVGQPVPNFTSGDECLFCHRDVGPGWPTNRHGQTIRTADPTSPAVSTLADATPLKNLASEVEFLLGGRNQKRFLKRSAEHGRLNLLSLAFIPSKSGADGRLANLEQPHWATKTFAARCAGCHATGVDSSKQSFAASSLDCFVCHGEPTDKHTTQGSLAMLSPHRRDSAAVVTSICAQCHLRTGRSKSSGLPYPNNFVAGDNLFRDFQVDWTTAAIEKLNPADRHIEENVRDVVLLGREETTCLTCHNIHQQSSQKHAILADAVLCKNCHLPDAKKTRIPYQVHSTTCGY